MSEESVTQVRAPTTASVRGPVRHFVELWLGAMFLKTETYAYERDQKNAFGSGLLYIALIGVVVALAHILSAGLRYATSPSLDAIKNTVLVHLQAMPFYETLSPSALEQFERGFQQSWEQFGSFFVGYPTNTASFVTLMLGVLTVPLGLIIGWLIYGALIHLIARGWNPQTSFSELLAPLALATSPYFLNVLTLFPAVGVSGITIALWTFICNVIAVRVAYQTTTRRAVWGALFPIVLLILLILFFSVCVIGLSSFAIMQRSDR